MSVGPTAPRGSRLLAGSGAGRLAGLGLVLVGVLLRPEWLVYLSPHRDLHPDTILTITFMRLFLVLLGPVALVWLSSGFTREPPPDSPGHVSRWRCRLAERAGRGRRAVSPTQSKPAEEAPAGPHPSTTPRELLRVSAQDAGAARKGNATDSLRDAGTLERTAARQRALLIALLVLVALVPRSLRLNSAYLDQHAHRQTDVATIARNFYEKDANILLPQVNWRADAPNIIESTFPLVPWLAFAGYRAVGEQPWVGRGLVALFALLGVIATFGLVALYWGQAAGFMAALFLALSPLAIYFGRALIDDTPAIALGIAGLWGVASWARGKETGSRRSLVLGLIALTLALLVKVVTLYLWFPLLAILWERWGRQTLRRPLAWAILVLPLLPSAAWYGWAHYLGQHYLTFGIGGAASGEPAYDVAYSKWGSPDFVTRPAFLRRVGDRIYRQVLTPAGVLALLSGLIAFAGRRRPGRLVFGAWLFGVVLFTAISGRAQSTHNYYQLPAASALAPFVGLGLAALGGLRQRLGRWAALGAVLLLAAFSARMLPYYYNDWQGWIPAEAGLIQSITAPDDRVITVTMGGDTTLLYHLHRPGWVVDFTNAEALAGVPEHIASGARVLVLQDLEYPQARTLPDQPWVQDLEVVDRAEHYAIYRIK